MSDEDNAWAIGFTLDLSEADVTSAYETLAARASMRSRHSFEHGQTSLSKPDPDLLP